MQTRVLETWPRRIDDRPWSSTRQDRGAAQMPEHEKTPQPPAESQDEQDVEGNSLLVGSSISTDLARGHRRDLEQQARERSRAKEARNNQPR
jgi:hypothetical protein